MYGYLTNCKARVVSGFFFLEERCLAQFKWLNEINQKKKIKNQGGP